MAQKKKAVPAVAKKIREVILREKRNTSRCSVCGEPSAPFSEENLCWVCRRLKISAWREGDNQAQVQE